MDDAEPENRVEQTGPRPFHGLRDDPLLGPLLGRDELAVLEEPVKEGVLLDVPVHEPLLGPFLVLGHVVDVVVAHENAAHGRLAAEDGRKVHGARERLAVFEHHQDVVYIFHVILATYEMNLRRCTQL